MVRGNCLGPASHGICRGEDRPRACPLPRGFVMERFTRQFDPRSLTVKDLLEARDTYHVHPARLANVVGTAVGLYRFRPNDKGARKKGPPGDRGYMA